MVPADIPHHTPTQPKPRQTPAAPALQTKTRPQKQNIQPPVTLRIRIAAVKQHITHIKTHMAVQHIRKPEERTPLLQARRRPTRHTRQIPQRLVPKLPAPTPSMVHPLRIPNHMPNTPHKPRRPLQNTMLITKPMRNLRTPHPTLRSQLKQTRRLVAGTRKKGLLKMSPQPQRPPACNRITHRPARHKLRIMMVVIPKTRLHLAVQTPGATQTSRHRSPKPRLPVTLLRTAAACRPHQQRTTQHSRQPHNPAAAQNRHTAAQHTQPAKRGGTHRRRDIQPAPPPFLPR